MSDQLVERLLKWEPCQANGVCRVHDVRSGCICYEAANRIRELEHCIRTVRDNMTMRRVFDFDYEKGEYPVTAEVIQMLVLDLHEARERIRELEQEVARLETELTSAVLARHEAEKRTQENSGDE